MMSSFRKFEIEDVQTPVILMNNEKNYKIYRERLKHLDQLKQKKITILINGRDSENSNIRQWVYDDQLRIDVVIANIKIRKTRLSKFIDRRVNQFYQLRFNELLLNRYPSGHKMNLDRVHLKCMLLVKLFAKCVWLTHKLTKIKMKDEVISVLKNSDCVFFTFPVQQKSSEWQCRLVPWCAERGLRSIFLVASWDNLTNRVPSAYGLPDEVVVWAQWQGEQANELWGYMASNIYTLNPRILLPKVFLVEEMVKRHSKNLKDSLTVGYLCSSSGVIDPNSELHLIKNLIELLSDLQKSGYVKHVTLAVRVHPLVVVSKTKNNYEDANLGQEIECKFLLPEGESGTIFKDDDVAELSGFISDSDVIVGVNTSTMIEAQAGGAVVLAMPSSICDKVVNHNFHAKQAERSGIYLIPKTYTEMKELLIEIVEGRKNDSNLMMNAREFLGSV